MTEVNYALESEKAEDPTPTPKAEPQSTTLQLREQRKKIKVEKQQFYEESVKLLNSMNSTLGMEMSVMSHNFHSFIEEVESDATP